MSRVGVDVERMLILAPDDLSCREVYEEVRRQLDDALGTDRHGELTEGWPFARRFLGSGRTEVTLCRGWAVAGRMDFRFEEADR